MKIVFAGINGTAEQYSFNSANNVTGILERVPVDGIIEILQLIAGNQDQIKIIHISDNSRSVRLDDKFMHEYKNWKNIKLLPSLLVNTFDDWKLAIKKGSETADYIIISNYRKIYKNSNKDIKVNPKEIIKWTMENATKPVIGSNTFVFEDGCHLAIATSPYEQGEVAASFALDIIKDNVINPCTQTKQFLVCVDEKGTLPGEHFSKIPKGYLVYAQHLGRFKAVGRKLNL